MRSGYRLPDEPQPSQFSQLVVDPKWPLFAMMLAGPWLGLPWFLVNTFALGSPTKAREIALVIVTIVVSGILLFSINIANGNSWLNNREMPYALLLIVALRLSCAYGLYVLQSRVCELFRYFGGHISSGMVFLALATVVGAPVIKPLLAQSWFGLVFL